KCIRCKKCIDSCNQNAIEFKGNRLCIDKEKCTNCKACVTKCPTHAIYYDSDDEDIDYIIDQCLKDIDFFEESGGGVTLSGGEPLMQIDVAVKILKKLKELNINTAVETTGFVNRDSLIKASKFIDLFLFDIKHWNRNSHKWATGVYNDLIIENLKYLIELKKNILVRIPIIPGFNDSINDAVKFSELFNKVGIKRVQLLPFHQFGENKYNLLNKDYYYKGEKSYKKEDINFISQTMKLNGIDAII
ncbi:MAG: glycyl-radical enzyme activating protein, partial [Tissierellia bacterium]|nr:glycyl-radical enzyme activating protein [Tissierellia bacterium]